MGDIQNEADIKLLVDSFYAKVKTDDLLGPIFLEKLGENWENHPLTPHDSPPSMPMTLPVI